MCLCKQKEILKEQINKKILIEKGYYDIYERFIVLNYSDKKPKDWYKLVNNASIWNKPILLVINSHGLRGRAKIKSVTMHT